MSYNHFLWLLTTPVNATQNSFASTFNPRVVLAASEPLWLVLHEARDGRAGPPTALGQMVEHSKFVRWLYSFHRGTLARFVRQWYVKGRT